MDHSKKVELLNESIEYAKGATTCEYTTEESGSLVPGCVIGQLGYRLGMSIHTLKEFDNRKNNSITELAESGDWGPLEQFPLGLLGKLQEEWDHAGDGVVVPSADEKRAVMRGIVEDWDAAYTVG